MLTELKFVQGAVAKKDFIPALTHFRIENGTVRGFNGVMAICCPIPFNLSCSPKAEMLVKAIGNCEETIAMHLTPAGRLSIKSGKFKAFVDCIGGETPHALPEGDSVAIDGDTLLRALKALSPFLGDDASRPWSNGVLFTGNSAFATNNVILAEYWTSMNLPHAINIPKTAVTEILRIGEPPVSMQMTENSITLHYSEQRWLRTQLFDASWPDLSKILDRESKPAPLNEELFAALEVLKPFADKYGSVIFRGDGVVATHHDATEGACYELENFAHAGVYNVDMLYKLKGAAAMIDWTTYPEPCMWFGENLRGAIIGMRTNA